MDIKKSILVMQNKELFRLPFFLLIIAFLVWIFLFGQPFQEKYINITISGLICFLFIALLYNKPFNFSAVDYCLIGYLSVATLSIIFCENKAVALEWYKKYFIPVPLIYLAARNIKPKDIYFIAWSIFTLGTAISLIALLEAIFHKNIIYELLVQTPYYHRFINPPYRIMSTLVHPTVFGSFLVGCIPFFYFLISSAKRIKLIFILAFLFLAILSIIFSFSRGNLIALTGLSLIYLTLKKKARYLIYLIIGVLILILSSSQMYPGRTRVDKGFYFQRFSLNYLLNRWWNSEQERIDITSKILKERPLLGIGLNHYRLKFDNYASDRTKRKEEWFKEYNRDYQEWKIADNMYLSIISETGIIGLLLFMAFLFLLFKRAFLSYRTKLDPLEKEFLIACLCAIIAMLISMNTYDLLYWINPLCLFWFLIGLLRANAYSVKARPR